MKTPEQVVAALNRWMEGNWQRAVLDPAADWPRRLSLGALTGKALEADFPSAMRWAHHWRDLASDYGVELDESPRRVHGTAQKLPTHLRLPDPDTAARLLGGEWPNLFRSARERTAITATCFPNADLAPVLRELTTLSQVDFNLLLSVASWFQTHDATGLTPRQVPIEGLDGKWLNTSQHLVRHLSGRGDLGLVNRPRTVHYTYLDPMHLKNGGRRHDSITIGDNAAPAYQPDTVIITENKDTVLFFPYFDHAIAIQGGGDAGPKHISLVPWVTACDTVIYWGDLDADGFEIINDYRSRGLDVRTVLMDTAALAQYRRFGVREDRKGNSLLRTRRNLPLLTHAELATYEILTDPDWNGPYRVEQERIPLNVAHQLISQSRYAYRNP
ncbi:hypothetical protein FDK12_07815 [Arthrobacter sp. NamB2]|uniref:Wadjet anti-phage system protein JetD domain-containing protein n=1 Tax=Arthrobacter sp. NamB2 TaxID=2576035 RepID=UPI0010C9BF7D|nr:DUF3322 and DUF2220 domain-containing protein [Arthrobacter sp. NamB2]TKV28555.1 hypothetical protein FDK12_07815 [Arthrobacter sp. NamB2]